MMYKNENLSYWVWASGHVLTDPIPYELMDMDSPDYDEQALDDFIIDHTPEDLHVQDVDLVWDAIETLAWNACKTFTFKSEVTIK